MPFASIRRTLKNVITRFHAHLAVYWHGKWTVQAEAGFDLSPPLSEGSPRDDKAQANQKMDELYKDCMRTRKLSPTARVVASMAPNKYWNRTWILQEILLSQHKGVVAFNHTDVPRPYFASDVGSLIGWFPAMITSTYGAHLMKLALYINCLRLHARCKFLPKAWGFTKPSSRFAPRNVAT